MSEDEDRRNESPKNKDECSRSGPRNLVLKRVDGGFGFTLRHFIVYPPESYSMLGGNARGDGSMDTIFVKWVRPGSPAAVAGLSTGDRLVRVNGEPVAGRPYAHVVRLIQQSPNILHLLVVPKEQDLLQLYFSDTAHNPETNQRPMKEIPIRSSSQQRTPCHISSESEGCRLSIDTTSRRGSQDTHSSDDSLIFNRIRKSLEQKEEFLRSPIVGNKEYYLRPGKLPAPHWPPAIPASSVQPRGPAVQNLNSPTDSVEGQNNIQSPTSPDSKSGMAL